MSSSDSDVFRFNPNIGLDIFTKTMAFNDFTLLLDLLDSEIVYLVFSDKGNKNKLP